MAWLRRLKSFFYDVPDASCTVNPHASQILLSLLRASAFWLGLQLLLVIPLFAVRKSESAMLAMLGVLSALLSIQLLRRGYFKAASYSFLFAVWAGTLISSILSGGIRSIYMVLHVWIPVVTALLLGTRAGIYAICASGFTTLALALIDGLGFEFPRYFPTPGITAWMVLMLSLITTALPVHQTLKALTDALESARHQASQYAHAALHDPLTLLPNRTCFLDRLSHCLRRGQGSRGHNYALLFIDIDDFKLVNDSFGHSAGDQLLRAFSERLTTLIRPIDTLARLGGDEFTILIEDAIDEREAAHLAELILVALDKPFRLKKQTIKLSISIGIAHGTDAYRHADEILSDADAAMYQAKSSGKNRYAILKKPEPRSARG